MFVLGSCDIMSMVMPRVLKRIGTLCMRLSILVPKRFVTPNKEDYVITSPPPSTNVQQRSSRIIALGRGPSIDAK